MGRDVSVDMHGRERYAGCIRGPEGQYGRYPNVHRRPSVGVVAPPGVTERTQARYATRCLHRVELARPRHFT